MLQKLKEKSGWIIFSIIFLLGLTERLVNINKSSFWYDEAFSGMLIKQDVSQIWNIIVQDRVHPPIYYYLLKLWATIFGNTDTMLRLFSVIFGMALVIAAFILVKRMFNTKAALATSGIFALSPFFIQYSLEARSYMMFAFEALIAVYLFVKIYKKEIKNIKEFIKIRDVQWLAVLFVIMLLTHYVSAALIGAICLLLFVKLFPKTEKFVWATLIAFLLVIIAHGLTNSGNFRFIPKEQTQTNWLADADLLTPGQMLYSFLFGVKSQAIGTQYPFALSFIKDNTPIYIVLMVLGIVLSMALINKKKKNLSAISKLFLMATLSTTIVCLFGINIFVPRYVMYLGVIFIVWIAALISQLNYKAIALLALGYIFLLTQVVWVPSTRNFTNLDLIQAEEKNNRVVTPSPFDYLVLKYYLTENRNLFLLDEDNQMNMKKNPWLFFDNAHVIDELLPSDYLI